MKRDYMAVAVFTVFSWICCLNAFAADLEIASTEAQAEKELTVTVSINSAPNEVYVFGLDLVYDPAMLEFKSYSFTGTLAENFEFHEVNPYSTGSIRIGGMDTGSNIIAQNASGTLVILTFNVIQQGSTQISIQNRIDDVAGWTASTAQIFSKDAYEPDNYYPQSGVIDKIQHHNFHEAGDADWGMIYGTAGKSYTLKTTNPETNCDTVIELYGIDGQTLILSENSSGAGGSERITWNCTQDTIYFVKIRNSNPNIFGDGTGYDLIVEYPPLFDAYEPDNDEYNARDITVDFRPQTHGFLSSGDEDWVQFAAVAGENYTIEMNPLESCDIAIELYGPNTASVKRSGESLTLLRSENSSGPGEGEVLVWQCPEDGRYYVRFYRYSSVKARSDQEPCEYNTQIYTQIITFPGFISGNVRTDSGLPFQNLKVEIKCENTDICNKLKCNTLTNAAGNYQFKSLMGIYTVQNFIEGGFVSYLDNDRKTVGNQVTLSESDNAGILIDIEAECHGDIKKDQDFSPGDALIAFNTYLEICPAYENKDENIKIECENVCCDVNKDGVCTSADALCIFKKAMERPSCLD